VVGRRVDGHLKVEADLLKAPGDVLEVVGAPAVCCVAGRGAVASTGSVRRGTGSPGTR
jgi:hypothetical protein